MIPQKRAYLSGSSRIVTSKWPQHICHTNKGTVNRSRQSGFTEMVTPERSCQRFYHRKVHVTGPTTPGAREL